MRMAGFFSLFSSLDKLKVNWKFKLNWDIPSGPPEPLSEVPEFLRQLEATAQTLLISESSMHFTD